VTADRWLPRVHDLRIGYVVLPSQLGRCNVSLKHRLRVAITLRGSGIGKGLMLN
jgi:hypothetical protein